MFRRSEVDRPRIKVDLLAASYEYVQKKKKKQKEIGFSSTLVPLNLKVVNGRVVQPNHGTEFSDIRTVFWNSCLRTAS